jgi:hypothetical protein
LSSSFDKVLANTWTAQVLGLTAATSAVDLFIQFAGVVARDELNVREARRGIVIALSIVRHFFVIGLSSSCKSAREKARHKISRA